MLKRSTKDQRQEVGFWIYYDPVKKQMCIRDRYGWVFGQVETQNNSYFEVLMLDANKGPRDCPFRCLLYTSLSGRITILRTAG